VSVAFADSLVEFDEDLFAANALPDTQTNALASRVARGLASQLPG